MSWFPEYHGPWNTFDPQSEGNAASQMQLWATPAVSGSHQSPGPYIPQV